MATICISSASFPTPALAFRGGGPAETCRVEAFAALQSRAADGSRRFLLSRLSAAESSRDRVEVLRRCHRALSEWRYNVACEAPGRLGVGLPLDAERFRTSLRAGGPNFDRVGDLGRLRAGAAWDERSRTFRGGAPTPASEILRAYGQAALERFAEERAGDVLVNQVVVPSGRLLPGNRLVRGMAAQRVAAELAERIAARGGDPNRMEVGGDPVYVVTADPDNADRLFAMALRLLADAVDLDEDARLQKWQQARYLLYQAPQMKKGSDAVTRVFLVAVGAVLLGAAPVLEQDVDLRCMVLGQHAATTMPADLPATR
ncbi:hypothetical protein [Amycolatopsis thailandensis]|uniref:hypothetical protein n=1 Tax=Amycolatopsis thailandensis TaxID=589330 RepID=UPI00362984AA